MAMIGAKRIVPMAEQPGPSAPVAGGTIDSLPSISFAPGIAPSPFGGGNIPSPYQPTMANIGPANDQGSPNAALLSAAMRSAGPGGAMSLPDMGPMTVGNEQITMPPPTPHRSFFMADGTGTGNRILGAIGDGLLGAAGRPGVYAPMMEQRHRDEQDHQWKLDDTLAELRARAHQPQYFSGKEDRLSFDPITGKTTTLYAAPSDAETYAKTLGFAEGAPDYTKAVQDYTLKGYGPTALANRQTLEGQRYDDRSSLQDDRYGYIGGLQDTRLAAYRRNSDARIAGSTANSMRATAARQRGQDMTDKRVRGSPAYQGYGGRGRGGGESAVAVGPNGHRIVVQNGRWVDAQTGAPVQ